MLKRKQLVILELLLEHGELYGLEMVDKSAGRLSRGGIYVVLGRMTRRGYVTPRDEPPPKHRGGLPRKMYKISPLGEQALEHANAVERSILSFAGGRS